MGIPILAIGDFNVILNEEDKIGGKEFELKRGMKELRECIDLGFSGPAFAWCNDQKGRQRVRVRLDRAFCSDALRLYFAGTSVRPLAQAGSDRCPIVVDWEG